MLYCSIFKVVILHLELAKPYTWHMLIAISTWEAFLTVLKEYAGLLLAVFYVLF